MALRFSPNRGAAAFSMNAMVRGPSGAAATVEVGTVTELDPGETPTVANAGTSSAATLNFGLPGTPTIEIGDVTTVAPGNPATVANSGTSSAIVLDFEIPQGAAGELAASGTPTVGQLGVWVTSSSLKGVSVTGLVKGNGASDPTAAVAGTDYYNPGGTDVALADGGTGASLADPNADRIMFWDDSAGAVTWLSLSGLTITGTSIAVDAASDTAAGKVELATGAETTTGTDATRAVTPDGLAGSDYGKAVVPILVFDDSESCTTGDGAGDVFYRVPAVLNGYNLVAVAAQVQTAGTTNTMDVQIARIRSGTPADMLSTKITIDSTEIDTATAATPAVINGSNDDVATADQIRIDVDAVHTTPAKGLLVELTFQLP